MGRIDLTYKRMCSYKNALLDELEMIDKKLEEIGTEQKNIVVKNISGHQYYYEQWNENGKTVSHSLGKVIPSTIAEMEKEIEVRKRLFDEKKEIIFLLEQLMKNIAVLENKIGDEKIIENYSFEVFWKEELTARVNVNEDKVKISRYCKHPLKQLFASDVMTRYQLNKILSMRCFEKERPDAMEKLKALGLKEYIPYEIVKRTHGVSYNDYIWFRFPKENIRAKDVLVRE